MVREGNVGAGRNSGWKVWGKAGAHAAACCGTARCPPAGSAALRAMPGIVSGLRHRLGGLVQRGAAAATAGPATALLKVRNECAPSSGLLIQWRGYAATCVRCASAAAAEAPTCGLGRRQSMGGVQVWHWERAAGWPAGQAGIEDSRCCLSAAATPSLRSQCLPSSAACTAGRRCSSRGRADRPRG